MKRMVCFFVATTVASLLMFGACAAGDADRSNNVSTVEVSDSDTEHAVGSDVGSDSDTGIDTGMDTGADSDADSDSDTESTCAEAEVTFDMQIPTVMLLVDRSGSMWDDFGDVDRWTAVRDTLVGPSEGIVRQLESKIRFGAQLYTNDDPYGGGVCPDLVGIDASLNNYDALHELFNENAPDDGDTPTGESIDEVVKILEQDTTPHTKIVVLATDGEPDTCAVPDPQEGHDEAIAAAQAAHAKGFPVYVIGVGEDVGQEHLGHMANAGQGYAITDPNGADFYEVQDPQSLIDAFSQIISQVRDCVLSLEGQVEPSMADECDVEVNSQPVDYNTLEGWRLNNLSEIELIGSSCDQIQEGDVNISVSCPCDAYGPVV